MHHNCLSVTKSNNLVMEKKLEERHFVLLDCHNHSFKTVFIEALLLVATTRKTTPAYF